MKDTHSRLHPLLFAYLILTLLFWLTHQQVATVRRKSVKDSSLGASKKQGIYVVGAIAGGAGAILGTYYIIKRHQRLSARKNALSRLHQHYNSKGVASISQQWSCNWFSDFEKILKDLVKKRRSFIFRKAEEEHSSLVTSYGFQKTNKFCFLLVVNGVDQQGQWEGEGEFTVTAQGPLFWMLKYYLSAQRVESAGEHKILVFESIQMDQSLVRGRWFTHGSEDVEEGSWIITNKDSRLE